MSSTCCICYNSTDDLDTITCKKCKLIYCSECFETMIETRLNNIDSPNKLLQNHNVDLFIKCPKCQEQFEFMDIVKILGLNTFKELFINNIAVLKFKYYMFRISEQNVYIDKIINLFNKYFIIYKIINRSSTIPEFLLKYSLDYLYININNCKVVNDNEFRMIKCSNKIKDKNTISYDIYLDLFNYYKLNLTQEEQINLIKKYKLNDYLSNIKTEINKLYEIIINNIKENNKSEYKIISKCECCKYGVIIDNNNLNYICNLCNSKYCPKCLKLISNNLNHICKLEDVDDWNYILKNSQSCPSCGARIIRSTGCNHMFCTNCGHGFDYLTGKYLANVVNSHKTEWNENINSHKTGLYVDDLADISKLNNKNYDKLLSYYIYLSEKLLDLSILKRNSSEINYKLLINIYLENFKNLDTEILCVYKDVYVISINNFIDEYSNTLLEILKYNIVVDTINKITDCIKNGLSKLIILNKNEEENDKEYLEIDEKIEEHKKYENEKDEIYNSLISKLKLLDNELYLCEKITKKYFEHFLFKPLPKPYDNKISLDLHKYNCVNTKNTNIYDILAELTELSNKYNKSGIEYILTFTHPEISHKYNQNYNLVEMVVLDYSNKYINMKTKKYEQTIHFINSFKFNPMAIYKSNYLSDEFKYHYFKFYVGY